MKESSLNGVLPPKTKGWHMVKHYLVASKFPKFLAKILPAGERSLFCAFFLTRAGVSMMGHP